MYTLVSYLEARIEALVDNRAELQLETERLRTVVFELCQEDFTQEYKDLMKQQVFQDVDEI